VLPLYLLKKLGKAIESFVNLYEYFLGWEAFLTLVLRETFSIICLHSSKTLWKKFGHFNLELYLKMQFLKKDMYLFSIMIYLDISETLKITADEYS